MGYGRDGVKGAEDSEEGGNEHLTLILINITFLKNDISFGVYLEGNIYLNLILLQNWKKNHQFVIFSKFAHFGLSSNMSNTT